MASRTRNFFRRFFLGQRWNLAARIKPHTPKQERSDALTSVQEQAHLLYRLDHTCGLHSHYRKGRLYDSSLERIVSLYREQHALQEEAWYLLDHLEESLRQVDPAFSPRRYGYRSFSNLVKENPVSFEIRRRAVKGRPIEARLVQEQVEIDVNDESCL